MKFHIAQGKDGGSLVKLSFLEFQTDCCFSRKARNSRALARGIASLGPRDAGIWQLFGGLNAPVSGRDFPMSGIFRAAVAQMGSIRAETGSLRPRESAFRVASFMSPLLWARATGP